jgi:hypothetical protein
VKFLPLRLVVLVIVFDEGRVDQGQVDPPFVVEMSKLVGRGRKVGQEVVVDPEREPSSALNIRDREVVHLAIVPERPVITGGWIIGDPRTVTWR